MGMNSARDDLNALVNSESSSVRPMNVMPETLGASVHFVKSCLDKSCLDKS